MGAILAFGPGEAAVCSRPVSMHPPLHFRWAVILGCIAMLVGVAGIFVFQRADEDQRTARPEDAAGIVVRGLETTQGIRVRVTWLDLEGKELEETAKPAGTAGQWLVRRTPSGVPVTIEVIEHANGTQRVLHAMPALLTRGCLFEVWLPKER